MNDPKQSVTMHFSPGNWIALAGLVLTPALGFASWGLSMNQQVTELRLMNQQNQRFNEKLATSFEVFVQRQEANNDLLTRIDERLKAIEKGK